MNWKKFVSVFAAGLMLVSLASCNGQAGGKSGGKGTEKEQSKETQAPAKESQKEGEKETEKAPDTAEAVKLNVVWFSDGKEGETFLNLTEKYRKDHPNVSFELIEVPYADLDNKIRNMLSAKEPPALARMTNVGPFLNQLADLRKYAPSGDAFPDQFGPGLQIIINDKMIGAPMEVTATGMIYNKTAFDKAGVKVPSGPDDVWTWEEFEKAAKEVMAKGGVRYGFGLDFTAHRLSTLFYQFGGGMLNEDMTAPEFNSENNKKAVELMIRLHKEKIMPESVWLGSDNPQEMFRAGQLATHIGGSWQIQNYKDTIKDFEWGVTYMPKGTQRSTVPGGKWISAFEGTGVEKPAAEFIEWISQPANNAEYCRQNYFLSQVKGNESLDYDFGSDFFKIFNNELSVTKPRPGREWGFQAFTAQVSNDMRDGMSSVLAGNETVDEYLNHMDELAKTALEELKG